MPLIFPGNPNDGDTYEPGSGAKYVWNAATNSWEWDFFNLGGAKAPVARCNGPYSASLGSPITFSSGGSYDRDTYIAAYDWDFGDGSAHSALPNPSHTYTATGQFTVTLVVTDNTGLTASDSTTSTVSEVGGTPPIAVLAGPVFSEPSVPVSFNASGSSDPDGTIVKYDWDWGDTTTSLNAGATPSHTYSTDGNYTVTVTVTDDSNLTDQATTTAFVATQGANPIPAENDLTAYPAASWELRTASTSGNNMGFARAESVNVGGTIDFCVDGDSTTIDIVRVGEYDGTNHARLVETISNTPANQPGETAIVGPNSESSFGGTDCTGWSTTASWTVPGNAVSGFYIAVVQGTPRQHIPFVVREDARAADVVILMPTNTDAAYNYYGGPIAGWDSGKSLYFQGPNLDWNRDNRAYAVSKHKPGITREKIINNYVRYHMAAAQWFERQGYNVKYITDDDLHGGLSWLGNSATLVMVGHNEYWTDEMRANTIALRELGKNLVVMSGNVLFWRIVKDPTNPHIIWCKKRTHPGATGDDYDPNTSSSTNDPQWLGWTGVWHDQRGPGLDPWGWTVKLPQEVTGQFFKMNAVPSPYQSVTVDGPTYQNSPFWRDTVVAAGTDLTINGIFGFEGDEPRDPGDGRGWVWLGDTTFTNTSCYDENGATVGTCTTTAGFAISRTDPAHGIVWSGGAMNTLWCLTDYHTGDTGFVNDEWRQAMANLFADLGAAADTLDVDLTTPTPVDIATYGFVFAPVAVISAPASVPADSPVAFDGTGSYDLDGSVVSYLWSFGDGNTSTASAPSYTYAVDGTYTATLTVTDNDGNTGQATHVVVVGAGDVNLFGALTPGTQNSADATDIVTAIRFTTSAVGEAVGIRFWANNAMTPSSVGLYEQATGTTGTLLASKAVGAVTPNDWNQVQFDSPVVLATNKTYVAALHLPGGNYPFDREFLLSADHTSDVLTAPQSDPINAGNGCYQYNATALSFPTQWGTVSPNIGTNYYVDVAFKQTQGNVSPVADAGGPYSAEPNQSIQFDGSASYDPDGTITSYAWTFGDTGTGSGATPTHTYTAEGNYTVTLTVTDNEGASHQDTVNAAIATQQATINIFGDLAPADSNVDFAAQYVLGTSFEVAVDGNVTGIRVYTSQTNMVSEVALYSAVNPAAIGSGTGTLLASKAVASTVAGWNDIAFDAPVAVTPGVTYVAQKLISSTFSDRTSGGFFNGTSYTNADLPTGRITATATDVTNNGNGRFVQSATMALANNWAASATISQWYGVDAVFEAIGTPIADAGGPYLGRANVSMSFDASASSDPFGSIVQYDWDFGDGGTLTNGGATPNHTYTTTVGSPFTVTVTVTDDEGNTDSATSEVTIAPPGVQPFFSGDLTWGSQGTDVQAYVQGSFFTPTASGQVTAIHMYESADMAAGSLNVNVYTVSPAPPYSDQDVITATPIGSAEAMTLTGAAGWRTLTLATPISVTAGTTYVVGCAPQAYLPNNAYVQELSTPPTIDGFGTINGAVGEGSRTGAIDRVRTTRYYPFDITFLAD